MSLVKKKKVGAGFYSAGLFIQQSELSGIIQSSEASALLSAVGAVLCFGIRSDIVPVP